MQGVEIYLFVTSSITYMSIVALCLRPKLSVNKQIEVSTIIKFSAAE